MSDGIEDTEDFLLPRPYFELPRRDLLAGVLAPYINNSNKALMHVLLCSYKNLPNDLNKSILLLNLIRFVHQTEIGRLD